MNTILKRKVSSILLILLMGVLSVSIQTAHAKKPALTADEIAERDNNKFPIGCRDVGYKMSLKVLYLYPGKEGVLQSMYFFFNKLPQTVNLYQMRDKDSEFSARYNHAINGKQWAALATGESEVRYICTINDDSSVYGKVIDCADALRVCEYVNVKFGLNNRGNFWIVQSNTKNGAVNEVVHYGIIPGV